MESGNSSSMQSSSGGGGGGGGGGEEEYDSSRATDQSISAFFDVHHNHHVNSSLPPPQQNNLSFLHFENNNNYFNETTTFSPVNQQPDPITQPDLRTFSSTSSLPPPIGVIKKTKKRSRASRRAPTTVLTTDTSNFRAMVQEFTGIPAPPLFNNNSVVNTTRLSTFLGLSSSNSYNSNNNLLLRPFAQKLIPNIQQYQNPNNSFENINLQALLHQAQIQNPKSNDHHHDQFGLGILQSTPSSTTTTPTTTTMVVANGNITTGDNGSNYGGCDNNGGTWLCSSSDQRS